MGRFKGAIVETARGTCCQKDERVIIVASPLNDDDDDDDGFAGVHAYTCVHTKTNNMSQSLYHP